MAANPLQHPHRRRLLSCASAHHFLALPRPTIGLLPILRAAHRSKLCRASSLLPHAVHVRGPGSAPPELGSHIADPHFSALPSAFRNGIDVLNADHCPLHLIFLVLSRSPALLVLVVVLIGVVGVAAGAKAVLPWQVRREWLVDGRLESADCRQVACAVLADAALRLGVVAL